jgi:hypothetical protein
MEADPGTKPLTIKNLIKNEQKKNSNSLSDGWNVRKSDGVRRSSIDVDTLNRFLVESQFRFILPCSIFLWALFLLLKN